MSEHNTFNIDWGLHGLLAVTGMEFQTVLDIGSGDGEHKRFLEYLGKNVQSVDFDKKADYEGDFMEMEIPEKFDLIWCSHVLEHQRNVGLFLEKCYGLLNDGGIFAVSVPCHSAKKILAGHLTVWSAYLVIYNLILAGFDCSDAGMSQDYDVSVIVRKSPAKTRFKNSAIGDGPPDEYATLREYFPMPVAHGQEQVDRIYYNMPKPVITKPLTITSRFLEEPLIVV